MMGGMGGSMSMAGASAPPPPPPSVSSTPLNNAPANANTIAPAYDYPALGMPRRNSMSGGVGGASQGAPASIRPLRYTAQTSAASNYGQSFYSLTPPSNTNPQMNNQSPSYSMYSSMAGAQQQSVPAHATGNPQSSSALQFPNFNSRLELPPVLPSTSLGDVLNTSNHSHGSTPASLDSPNPLPPHHPGLSSRMRAASMPTPAFALGSNNSNNNSNGVSSSGHSSLFALKSDTSTPTISLSPHFHSIPVVTGLIPALTPAWSHFGTTNSSTSSSNSNPSSSIPGAGSDQSINGNFDPSSSSSWQQLVGVGGNISSILNAAGLNGLSAGQLNMSNNNSTGHVPNNSNSNSTGNPSQSNAPGWGRTRSSSLTSSVNSLANITNVLSNNGSQANSNNGHNVAGVVSTAALAASADLQNNANGNSFNEMPPAGSVM
jgi:hypothetical protein